jgi:hypothetical protein
VALVAHEAALEALSARHEMQSLRFSRQQLCQQSCQRWHPRLLTDTLEKGYG